MFKEFTTAGLIFISVSWISVLALLIFSFYKAMQDNKLHDGD